MGKKCVYSLGQNIVDKFVKLSNICFSMECFKLVFCKFLARLSKLALGHWLCTF